MQISKILTHKKALIAALGLACASMITFSAPAQAYGCSTCKVVKYKVYRNYGCGYRCYNRCYNRCYTPCNTCNTCNYGYSCNGCGYGYGYYGGYYY